MDHPRQQAELAVAEGYLGPESVEDLGRMLMALLTEHWILRDRFALMEALMIERGALAEGELEDYVPGPAVASRIEALRARTVSAVIGAPLAARDRSVDAIISRALPKT